MQQHLKIKKGDIAQLVLLPGDPSRVNVIAKKLKSPILIAENREFKLLNGLYKGKRITICSTGVGSPSTAIAVEELISAGATKLIRIGTCGGSWRSDVAAGNVMIPTASIRDEGTTLEYIPAGFPAVADTTIVNSLISAAGKLNMPFVSGINRTHDAFYGSQSAIKKWGEYLNDQRFIGCDTPIYSSEMECSALFVIASLRNVAAGAVLAIDANPEPLKDRLNGRMQKVKTYSSEKVNKLAVDSMLDIALEASFNLLK